MSTCVLCDCRYHRLHNGFNAADTVAAHCNYDDTIVVSMGHYHNDRLYDICDECFGSPKACPIVHISLCFTGKTPASFVRIDNTWCTYGIIQDYTVGSIRISPNDSQIPHETITILNTAAIEFVEWLKTPE